MKSTGDGVLATFPLARRALRFAAEAVALGEQLGVRVRVGVHAGEVDPRGEDLSGVAVNLSARLVAIAGAGQVVVSSTVRDLARGASLAFCDLGTHTLEGFAEPWRAYELELG